MYVVIVFVPSARRVPLHPTTPHMESLLLPRITDPASGCSGIVQQKCDNRTTEAKPIQALDLPRDRLLTGGEQAVLDGQASADGVLLCTKPPV